jgi:hypothetical protein
MVSLGYQDIRLNRHCDQSGLRRRKINQSRVDVILALDCLAALATTDEVQCEAITVS